MTLKEIDIDHIFAKRWRENGILSELKKKVWSQIEGTGKREKKGKVKCGDRKETKKTLQELAGKTVQEWVK